MRGVGWKETVSESVWPERVRFPCEITVYRVLWGAAVVSRRNWSVSPGAAGVCPVWVTCMKEPEGE